MNKQEFLRELEKYLNILEKAEQRDILDEYSWHIEMKMQKGMSEEEAIKDFGNLEELVQEILGAYHVNCDYSKQENNKCENENQDSKVSIGAEEVVTEERKSGIWQKTIALITKLCAVTMAFLLWPFKKTKEGLNYIKESYAQRRASRRQKNAEGKAAGSAGGFFARCMGAMKRGTVKLAIGCWNLTIWAIRWCWNLTVLLALFMVGLFEGMFVLGFGMCLVLSLVGYPLIGVSFVLLGLALSGGVLTIMVAKLLILKKSDKPERVEGLHNGVVGNEVICGA